MSYNLAGRVPFGFFIIGGEMRDTDLTLLKVLHEQKNITKTSEMIYVSQPSVTKRIHQLEEEFDVQILNRSTKGVSFTPQGEYLVKRFEEILQILNETHNTIREMDDPNMFLINILAPNSYIGILAEDLNSFKEDIAQVTYTIKAELSSVIVKTIEQSGAHLGFVNGEFDDSVKVNKLRVRVSQAYAVSDKPFEISDMDKLSRIEHNRDKLTTDILDNWWKSYFGSPARIDTKVNHHSTAMQMVASGFGYTLSFYNDQGMIPKEMFTIPLVYRDGSPVVRNTWMIWSATEELKPVVSDFIAFMAETHQDLN